MSTAHEHLSPQVLDQLNSRYGDKPEYRALFFWLWDELKAVAPETTCKATERYIGLYPSEGDGRIFAYIDCQSSHLLFGVSTTVFERLKPQTYEASHFPDWNTSTPLTGLSVHRQNAELIDVLVAARKARVDGLVTIQPLPMIPPFEPFDLADARKSRRRLAKVRPGQKRFRVLVEERYGAECAVCGIGIQSMLQAAHIVAKEFKGTDDPLNGLMLCANHHLAFDAKLFSIDPDTWKINPCPSMTFTTLEISRKTLRHLQKKPAPEALELRNASD